MQSENTLVVIPAFNEEVTVGQVVTTLRHHGWKCLVVNDGSTDQTETRACEAGAVVVSHSINLGVGLALQTGFKWALQHDFSKVVQFDADGQHDSLQISRLLSAQEAFNADLVIGSRFLDSQNSNFVLSGHRKAAIELLSKIIYLKTKKKITDPTSGFRCISQPLLEQFAQNFSAQYLGDTFEANIAALEAGYSVTEIHTDMFNRQHGTSSASFLQSVRYLGRVFVISALNLNFKISRK